jgi:hypothetical protein
VAGSALTPQAAVEELEEMSSDISAAILLGGRGELLARGGADAPRAEHLRDLAAKLLATADDAGVRAGLERVGRVELSSPRGTVFAVREDGRGGSGSTLVAVASGGALSSLVLYDMRMTLARLGSDPALGGADERAPGGERVSERQAGRG